jgi:hypothetical protein
LLIRSWAVISLSVNRGRSTLNALSIAAAR